MWGHSLKKMSLAAQKERLDKLLSSAALEYRPTGGSLFFTGTSLAFIQQQFRDLLGTETACNFSQLTPEQCESCLDTLIRSEAAATAIPLLQLSQSFDITKWRIGEEAASTESILISHYGTKACLTTMLYFETLEHFECIRKTVQSIMGIELNAKYLKQVR